MDGCYESALYQFGYWAAGPDCHEMRIFGLFLPFDRLDRCPAQRRTAD